VGKKGRFIEHHDDQNRGKGGNGKKTGGAPAKFLKCGNAKVSTLKGGGESSGVLTERLAYILVQKHGKEGKDVRGSKKNLAGE